MHNIKKKGITLALIFALLVCIYAPLKADAKCLSSCNGIYSFRGITTRESSYDHTYIYGTCRVKVTEKYQVYSCPCGAKRYEERISRTENHSHTH